MPSMRFFCEECPPSGHSFFPVIQRRHRPGFHIASRNRVVNEVASASVGGHIGACLRLKALRFVAGMLLVQAAPASQAAVAWDGEWEVAINGQRISIETFTSSAAPDVVLRTILARNEAYDRYLVSEGRLLLSGLGPDAHWLAGIEGRAGGSQGYVSALYFNPERQQDQGAHAAGNIPGALALAGLRHKQGGVASSVGGQAAHAPLTRRFEFSHSAVVRLVAEAAAGSGNVAAPVPGASTALIPPSGGSPFAVWVSIPEQ